MADELIPHAPVTQAAFLPVTLPWALGSAVFHPYKRYPTYVVETSGYKRYIPNGHAQVSYALFLHVLPYARICMICFCPRGSAVSSGAILCGAGPSARVSSCCSSSPSWCVYRMIRHARTQSVGKYQSCMF